MTDTENLTPSQARVLGLLREGLTPKQAAKKLRITVNGVYAHQRKIRDKGISTDPIEDEPPVEAAESNGGVSLDQTVIEAVREGIGVQIAHVDERLGSIEVRAKEIAELEAQLSDEAKALSNERALLARTRESLQEASSGEPVPF